MADAVIGDVPHTTYSSKGLPPLGSDVTMLSVPIAIAFHNGSVITFHNGSQIEFHNPFTISPAINFSFRPPRWVYRGDTDGIH